MENENSISVSSKICEDAFCVIFKIDNKIKDFKNSDYYKNAKYKADIRIKINNQFRDFTFEEFAERLGMKWE